MNTFLKTEPVPTQGFIAAKDWLATQKPSKRTNRRSTSYGYKHQAERWNRERGIEVYIAEQELISAANYLGFKMVATDDTHTSAKQYQALYGETYTSVLLNIAPSSR